MANSDSTHGSIGTSLNVLKQEEVVIRLTREQYDLALQAISEINLGAAAAHQLMGDAAEQRNMHDAGYYLTAVENIAKVTCRKCDVLAALLGEPGFGNFAKEFEVRRAVPVELSRDA